MSSSSSSSGSFGSKPKELVGSHKDLLSSHTLVVRIDDANVAEDSSSDAALSDPPRRMGYDWVSPFVTKQSTEYG